MDQNTVDELQGLESLLWRPEIRFDPEGMDRLLAPDFLEYGRSGRIYTRQDILAVHSPPDAFRATFPLPYFRAGFLSRDAALVTYVSEIHFDTGSERANRSSIWIRTASSWLLRFHQGIPTG
ncbi:DUF4440 domain-containing protein [Thalassococcus sp. S3]|uniref:nuclear transport factor 2 family protein n=1 Tax=Thalassococcus sp. S3 TaxID=2017482 RepID=UPI0010245002|nr:DUF4440 domain-containing protein [Thalassococcus sp. S3]QBF31950.1 DUF4440 domain-containing protein [Thalassococcus sp. S3]